MIDDDLWVRIIYRIASGYRKLALETDHRASSSAFYFEGCQLCLENRKDDL